MEARLKEVLEWAKGKIATGAEPPWAWYQYMKLIETLEAILGAQATASPTGSSQQSGQHSEMHLRLVDSTYRQDDARCHPSDEPLRLPM